MEMTGQLQALAALPLEVISIFMDLCTDRMISNSFILIYINDYKERYHCMQCQCVTLALEWKATNIFF
jgi:hypothetical protein